MAKPEILKCSKLMAEQGLTISFAESATAGWLCSEFALAPESGKILKGGIVCYDAELKKDILGVPESIIEEFTPESAEVTQEMALRLKNVIKADITVGVTGLTTPGGSESDEKPVGTMFVHALVHDVPVKFRKVFEGNDEDIIRQTVVATAEMLSEHLKSKS